MNKIDKIEEFHNLNERINGILKPNSDYYINENELSNYEKLIDMIDNSNVQIRNELFYRELMTDIWECISLSGQSVEQIADEMNVHEMEVYEWLRYPETIQFNEFIKLAEAIGAKISFELVDNTQ